jgi:hypothetical protein
MEEPMAKGARKDKIVIVGTMQAAAGGGPVATIPGGSGVQLHSFLGFGKKDVDFGEFLQRWRKISDQVSTLISETAAKVVGKMVLDEVEVSIGVSGEGTIGIATAKGEASVVLKFKRTP